MSRGSFWCVIATIFATSMLLDWFFIPAQGGLGTLVVACGPLNLYHHHQWMGMPRDGVIIGVVTAIATFLYLIFPNRFTLGISTLGGIAWAYSGYFWIAMLA